MLLRYEIAALRGDDAPQRQAQAALTEAMEHWRQSAIAAPVLADLERFAQGAELAECPDLAALFAASNDTAAHHFAASFITAMVAALRATPLGHVAARHFTNGLTSTLLLGRAGEVTLALAALGEGAKQPDSISFSPVTCWERVLAGGAEAQIITCHPQAPDSAQLLTTDLQLEPGQAIIRDGAHQALVYGKVAGCMVSLRLQRRQPDAGPVREYDCASGRLVHRAAGSQRESRRALMANLLGRMGRRDAAPLLAEMACEAGPDALRWQALRECLGLDTGAGFAALCTIASASGDVLAGPAGALRAQLVEAHPQLADMLSGVTG